MRAGRLRHLVELQRNTPVASNKLNEPTDNWQTLASVHAGVEPISGREFFAAHQVQSDVSHRITVRFYPGLTPKDRVAWVNRPLGGVTVTRIFDIKAILDRDEKHREMQLMCVEHG